MSLETALSTKENSKRGINMDNNYNFGERLRALRVARGLSQEQLALQAGITPTYLGMLERNIKNPTLKVIEQLCQSLNISLNHFFSDCQPETAPDDPSIQQTISLLATCTEKERKLLLQLIKDALKFKTV